MTGSRLGPALATAGFSDTVAFGDDDEAIDAPPGIGDEHKEEVKGTWSDLQNLGKGREGGALTAAGFLSHFATGVPWAHLDIAGTAYNFTKKPYIPSKGPSGIGVRTLLELIRNWKQA